MKSGFLRSGAFAAVVILSLAACGGGIGGANQNEPAGAVRAALEAAQSGGFAKLTDFACAAKKGDPTSLLGSGGVEALAGTGIDPDDLLGAVKFEFKDIQATEKSRSGDAAIVNLTASTTVTVDPAKFREMMKAAMAAQGTPVDDATLDAVIASMSSQLTTTQALNSDVTVVQEGGKWLIC